MRTLEVAVMAVLVGQVPRLWWRKNRGRVRRCLPWVKDRRPRKRHLKSPKQCLHCWTGVQLERVRVNIADPHSGVVWVAGM